MKNNLLLVLVFACFRMFPQTGEIKGKLLLQDSGNIESVRNNTWIFLKTATKSDSVKVNHDLGFIFKDVKPDTIRIYIKPRLYPINRSYKFYFDGKPLKEFEFEYSSTCPFGKKNDNTCPTCHKKDKVIPIRYGLMAEIMDRSKKKKPKDKYKAGGCVVSDCQPNWFCERDEKDF